MSPEQSKKILHSALLAAGRTLSLDDLLGLFANNATAPARSDVKELLDELERDLAEHVCELKLVASGYRLQIREEYSAHLSSLWAERPARYSRALHETLALIAYRQPITRGEIEDIRGVSVSSTIIKTLLEREWIRAVGHRDVPGRPAIYGTTRAFLDNFNLESLEALPPLAEIRDLDTVSDDLFAKTAVQGDDALPASAAVASEDGPPADASDDAPAVDADQQPTAESSSDEHGVSKDADALPDGDAQSAQLEPVSADDALDADETQTVQTSADSVSQDTDALSDDDAQSVEPEPGSVDDALDADESQTVQTSADSVSQDTDALSDDDAQSVKPEPGSVDDALDVDESQAVQTSAHGVSQDADALPDDDAQSAQLEPGSVDDAPDADEAQTAPTDVSDDADADVSQLTSESESASQDLEVEDHDQVADDESTRDGVEVINSAGDNASPANDDSLDDASTHSEDNTLANSTRSSSADPESGEDDSKL